MFYGMVSNDASYMCVICGEGILYFKHNFCKDL